MKFYIQIYRVIILRAKLLSKFRQDPLNAVTPCTAKNTKGLFAKTLQPWGCYQYLPLGNIRIFFHFASAVPGPLWIIRGKMTIFHSQIIWKCLYLLYCCFFHEIRYFISFTDYLYQLLKHHQDETQSIKSYNHYHTLHQTTQIMNFTAATRLEGLYVLPTNICDFFTDFVMKFQQN